MDHLCVNCAFVDLENDDFPCIDCSHCSSINKTDHWIAEPEAIINSKEMMRAILKTQLYAMTEIGRLRKELNRLKE